MKSQADIKKIVPANSVLNIQTRGEFVFYKTGASAITTVVNNNPVEMEPGDIRKFPGAEFESFEVHNNTGIDQPIVLTVGYGEYNRLVVRGDISSFESVLGTDGIARPDTRRKNDFVFGFTDPGIVNQNGFFIAGNVAPLIDAEKVVVDASTDSRGNLIVLYDEWHESNIELFDKNTGALLKTGSVEGKPLSITTHPTLGNIVIHGAPDDGVYDRSILNNDLTSVKTENYFDRTEYFCYWPSGQELVIEGSDLKIHASIDDQVGLISMGEDDGVSTRLLGSIIGSSRVKAVADPENDDCLYLSDYDVESATKVAHFNWKTMTVLATYTAEFWENKRLSTEYNHLMKRWEAGTGAMGQSQRVILEKLNKSIFGSGRVQLASEQNFFGTSKTFELLQTDSNHSYNESTGILKANAIYQTFAGFFAKYEKSVPSNYLDYVHALAINGREILNTGSQSFARAKIKDTFEIKNGDVISLTHTQELEPALND